MRVVLSAAAAVYVCLPLAVGEVECGIVEQFHSHRLMRGGGRGDGGGVSRHLARCTETEDRHEEGEEEKEEKEREEEKGGGGNR